MPSLTHYPLGNRKEKKGRKGLDLVSRGAVRVPISIHQSAAFKTFKVRTAHDEGEGGGKDYNSPPRLTQHPKAYHGSIPQGGPFDTYSY